MASPNGCLPTTSCSAEDALGQQIGTGLRLIGRRRICSTFPIEIMLSPVDTPEGLLVTAAIRDVSVRHQAVEHLLRKVAELNRSNEDLRPVCLRRFARFARAVADGPRASRNCCHRRYTGRLDAGRRRVHRHTRSMAQNRMQCLIQDLLACSRVAAKGQPLRHTSSAEALNHSLLNLHTAIEEHGGVVVTHDVMPDVAADRVQLIQLFLDLRPGTYAVTFTLPGFNTVKRDGVELSGAATATSTPSCGSARSKRRSPSPARRRPSTCRTPRASRCSTPRRSTRSRPAGTTQNLGILIPGVTAVNNGQTRQQDVGGALGDTMASLTIHGSKPADHAHHAQRRRHRDAAGRRQHRRRDAGRGGGGGNDRSTRVGVGGAVDRRRRASTSSRATAATTFRGFFFGTFTNEALQGDNLTDDSCARGLHDGRAASRRSRTSTRRSAARSSATRCGSGRHRPLQQAQNYAGGHVRQQERVQPERVALRAGHRASRRSPTRRAWAQLQTRVTWQATQEQVRVHLRAAELLPLPVEHQRHAAPEAAHDRRFPRQQQLHAEWTSPVTNRLLLEAVGMHLYERWGNMHARSARHFFTPAVARDRQPRRDHGRTRAVERRYPRTCSQRHRRNLQQHLGAELLLPRGGVVRHRHAQLQGRLQPRRTATRRRGTYDFQPVQLPLQQRRAEPDHACGRRRTTSRTTWTTTSGSSRRTSGRWTADAQRRAALRLVQDQLPEQARRSRPARADPQHHVPGAGQPGLEGHHATRSAPSYDLFGNGRTALKVSAEQVPAAGRRSTASAQDPNPVNTLRQHARRATVERTRQRQLRRRTAT